MNTKKAKRIWDDHWVKFAISFLIVTVIGGSLTYKVNRLDAADEACASVARKNSERIGKVEVVIPRIDDDVRETKQDVKEIKRDVSELKEMVGIILERTK